MAKNLFLFLISSLLFARLAQAETPPADLVIRLDTCYIVKPPLPAQGDTVSLLVAYESNITGHLLLSFYLDGQAAPLGSTPGENILDSVVAVDSGDTYFFTLPVKLTQYGSSMVEFWVRDTITTSPTFAPFYHYMTLDHSVSGFSTYPAGTGVTPDSLSLTNESRVGINATLSVSGKVMFKQEVDVCSRPGHFEKRGVYGLRMVIAFKKKDPITGLPLPGYYHPISGCTEGIHYSIVDVDGNYQFSFSVSSFSDYTRLVVFPSSGNDAAYYSSETAMISVIRAGGCPEREVFAFPISGLPISPPATSVTGTLNFNFPAGFAVLRSMQFGREFAEARPLASVPEGPLPIKVIGPYSPDAAGEFSALYTGIGFEFKSWWLYNVAVALHEYGHHAAATLSIGYGSMGEAWATFYGEAVRQYMAGTYALNGEFLPDCYSLEQLPFRPTTEEFHACNLYHTISTPPYEQWEPYHPGPICLLWNLYDKVHDPGFKAPMYDDMDNDDLGETDVVFTTPLRNDLADYYDDVLAAIGSDKAYSWYSMYDQMILDENKRMRPVQIKNASGYVNSSFDCTLSWTHQTYPSTYLSGPLRNGPSYQNLPTDVAVYSPDNYGGWNLVGNTEFPSETTGEFGVWSFYEVFKVTSTHIGYYGTHYDSYNAPLIETFPLKRGTPYSAGNSSLSLTLAEGSGSDFATSVTANEQEVLNILLFDALGRKISTVFSGIPSARKFDVHFSSSGLAKGAYFLVGSTLHASAMIPIVIAK